MSAKNRLALAELRAKLGNRQEPVVDLAPKIASIMATVDAHHAGRPYSMVPRSEPAPPLCPAGERFRARIDQLRKALDTEKTGGLRG